MPLIQISNPRFEPLPTNRSLSYNTTLALITIVALALAGCQSKAAEEKHREKVLESFATKVTKHLLDRNPATIHESMTTLTHVELDDKLQDKLENDKVMPETEIDIMKIVSEGEAKKLSNTVVVESATPQGDTDKDVVPIKVVGKDVKLVDGKEAESKDFTYIITCKLTPEMEDFPRAIDFAGATGAKPAAEKSAEAKSTHRSRRHRH